MSRLNSSLKLSMFVVNLVFMLAGLGLIGAAAFVLSSDWGALDPQFYSDWCAGMIVVGVVVLFLACFGWCGTVYQTNREGFCTGRRMLGTYEIAVLAILILQMYFLVRIYDIIHTLSETKDELSTPGPTEYTKFERGLARNFDEFYFSAMETCNDNKYNWLWDWVDDHCPTTMQSDNCEGGCLTTPVEASCPDESMCSYAGEAHWTYCPYDTCRPEILGFVIRNLTPFADFMLFMTIFEVALLLINCLLICYNPRDNVEEMLIKAGTLTKKRSYVRRP